MSKIEKYDNFGRGITYINNKITFVPNTIIDEDIDVQIIEEHKNYQLGKCIKINNPSEKRIKPKCPYYGICGGCDLQHLSYQDQANFKLDKIKKIFEINNIKYQKIGFIKSDKDYYYRNKITLKVLNGKIGYYENKTNNLVEINECLLAKDCINELIKQLSFDNNTSGEIVIRCNNNNELLISLNGNLSLNRKDLPPELKIVGIVSNGKAIYGDDFLITDLGGTLYKYSYNSFFQVNDYICIKLFEILKNNIKDGNVLDLYCGVGSLSIQEQNTNNKVYGIEIVENAIKNAIVNAKINRKNNMYFMLGDVAKVVDKINGNIDYLVVDPPRSGLDKKTISYIINEKINNMIYISCNPDTLVRDLKLLSDLYKIIEVTACDMFPNTYHVETICILERK